MGLAGDRAAALDFRIGLAAGFLALALTGTLFSVAQSGPGWEVPVRVLQALQIGPVLALFLALAGWMITRRACRPGAIPTGSRVGSIAVVLAVLAGSALLFLVEPAQWPGRHPALSHAATALPLPVMACCGFGFWLLGFRWLPSAPCRCGVRAILVVAASTVSLLALTLAAIVLVQA